jgi:MFS family permease
MNADIEKSESSCMRAYTMLVFLTLLNVLNFTDRFLMQGFAVDMIADLHLSNFQYTLLTGFVFTTFYTFVGLFMGALADRMHRPRLIACGILLWSALTAATGKANNFLQVALVRMLTGVGEATLTPAALGLLGDAFDRKNRGFAAGFYYLGAPIGIGSAFLIAGTLGARIGWRNCFFLLGASGLVLTGFLFMLREPRREHSLTPNVSPRQILNLFQEIRSSLSDSPALCLVILGGVLVIFAQGAFVLDQLWLVQERAFNKQHAQNLAGMMFLIGGIIGAVLGGYGADKMEAHRVGGRLRFLAITYSLGVPIGFIFRFTTPAEPVFYLCMFVGSIMVTIGYGPIFASLQDLVAKSLRSTITAFLILCMTLFGTSGGNLLVGWLADLFKYLDAQEPITTAVVIGMCPWLLSIPCFYVAARLVERASQELTYQLVLTETTNGSL